MLIRYGLAHILAFIVALPVFYAAVRASYAMLPAGARQGFARRALAKTLRYLGILSLLLIPCLIFSFCTIVRVIDDGPGTTLTWRRYLMLGSHATAITDGGARLDVANQPGEIIVNATRGPIILLPLHYGYGYDTEDIPPQQQLAPGQMAAYRLYVIFLGHPPDSIQTEANGSTIKRVYIFRAN